MNITSKSKYALRAMIHLAQNGAGIMRREDLAIAQGGISKEYLEKILLRLREVGVVEAKSGRGGGYRLAKPADELTAWDIIVAVEDSPEPVSCLGSQPVNCTNHCGAKSLWKRVWDAAVQEMKNSTLSSLVEEEFETFGIIQQTPLGNSESEGDTITITQCR
ncbi:MAG: RrF2 family transcriptional regulator [Planctomycetota bacterium]|jgi:Rrf2 family protein